MKVESYPPEQVDRIEFALAFAALTITQRVRLDRLDVLHGRDDLAVMVREGLLVTEGVIAGHAELTPRGLYWINRRLLMQRIERGPGPREAGPAWLHTHELLSGRLDDNTGASDVSDLLHGHEADPLA